MAKRILRCPAVLERTGFSHSTLYAYMAEGRFPRPISIGRRAVGWIEDEVEEWLNRQIEASRKAAK